jgi:hypothetical protein
VSQSSEDLTLGAAILSNNDSRLPDPAVGGDSAVRSDQVGHGRLADLSGLTLVELRDLRDAQDESYLAQALSRVMGSEASGFHNFNSNI